MTKIAIIGAGGVIFAQNFIKDILLDKELRQCRVTLMDIDRGRLDNAGKMAEMTSKQLGVDFKPELTTDLKKAVRGANYVITIFRSGTLEHQRLEYEIPAKYGVKQVVGDTLGPGGVFRGLRTLKPLFEVLDAMESECPGAYLLNYVNPMSMNTIALSKRARTVKVLGLCHSVQCTITDIGKWLNVPLEKLHYYAAGINHQAFMMKLETEGRDLYPELRKCLDNPEIYNGDKVRFELMRHFDFFPTESSGHGSEYIPYIRKREDLLEKFCSVTPPVDLKDSCHAYLMCAGVSGASLTVCSKLQVLNEQKLQRLLAGEEKIDSKPSLEYGVQIIQAMEKNVPFSANLNVMNDGLIANLPPDACVEVPCLVSGGGVFPGRVENYPEQLAALNRGMINVQIQAAQGALNCSRRDIFHAIAADPLTAAVLGLDEIQQMTDEMFDALESEIAPGFSNKNLEIHIA